MRIRNTSIRVELKLKITGTETPVFKFLNGQGNQLSTNQILKNNHIYVDTELNKFGGKIFLQIEGLGHSNVELTSLSLMKIPITEKQTLEKIVRFRSGANFENLYDYSETENLYWDNGIVSFEFFNNNPIAYLMYIGTRIKIGNIGRVEKKT